MSELGLNIASLLPWSAFPAIDWVAKYFAVPIAEKMTKQIGGIDFWQVLPLKGVTAKTLSKSGVTVEYIEKAWNPTTLLRHLVRKPGMSGQQTKPEDIVFFPPPKVCKQRVEKITDKFPNAALIGHDLYRPGIDGPTRMVEINPEMGLPTEALAKFWAPMHAQENSFPNGRSIVLDLRHIRRERLGGAKNPLHGWRETYKHLLPYTGLIHVQPLNASELRFTINSVETELVRMIKTAVDGGYTEDFVIEVAPNLLGGPRYYLIPQRMTRLLRSFRRVVKEVVK